MSIGRANRLVLKDSAIARSLWMSSGHESASTYLAPPSATAELVIVVRNDEPRLFVIGPRRAALWKNTRGLSATATLNLRPGVLQTAFGVSPLDLCDVAISADEVFDRSDVAGTLDLAMKTSVAEAARSFARTLAARVKPSRRAHLAELAVDLAAHGEARPHALAAHLGVSARTLRRLLGDELGVTPRELTRFARGSRLLARILRAPRATTLADIALDCGYADQAHMTNDARRLFGRSPAAIARDAANALIANAG